MGSSNSTSKPAETNITTPGNTPPCCPPGSHGAVEMSEEDASKCCGETYKIPGEGDHSVYITGKGMLCLFSLCLFSISS